MSLLKRSELAQRCEQNIDQIIQGAASVNRTVPDYMQGLSPIADNKDDAKAALADILYYQGVTLSDDADNGLTATTWSEVKQKPQWVQRLFIIHQSSQARKGVQTYRSKMKQVRKERNEMKMARTYDASQAGSANRPFADTELFNSERGLEFPPAEVIFADTRFPTSTAVRVLEYKPLTPEQIARNYAEGTEVDVVTLDYNQTNVPMKRIASGIEYSHEQDIAGELTSELISEYMVERGAEVVNRRVKDAVVLLAGKAKEGSRGAVELKKDNGEGLLKAIVETPKRFVWTTVLGRADTIQRYLGLDRSRFYAGPRELPGGTTVGTDFYGKAPLPRYVADVPNDYGIGANELMFLDASEAALLHILQNSELETSEFVNRTRMNEIIWSASMGVSEKYPSQTDEAKRPYRIYTLEA